MIDATDMLRRISPAIIVDVETGGFDPTSDALLQVAVMVVLDGKAISVGHQRILPRAGTTVQREAARLLDFEDEVQWMQRGARPEPEALAGLYEDVRRVVADAGPCTWIGHNTGFDRVFLDHAQVTPGRSLADLCHHRDVDTMALGTVAQAAGIVESRSLDALGRAAGFCRSRQTIHDAVEDVQLTWEVLQWLLSHLRWIP